MAIVETRDLTKVFKQGQLGAVNEVNLLTREGEFMVFLGPSGSGKTTLLRMIAGLEEPTRGDVLIGGRVVTRLPPGAVCHVAYVDVKANPNANELARKAADENARDFKCGKDKTRIIGERGRAAELASQR